MNIWRLMAQVADRSAVISNMAGSRLPTISSRCIEAVKQQTDAAPDAVDPAGSRAIIDCLILRIGETSGSLPDISKADCL